MPSATLSRTRSYRRKAHGVGPLPGWANFRSVERSPGRARIPPAERISSGLGERVPYRERVS